MPYRPPRLVATDLDGTLLRSDGTISPRTRDTLTALDGRGTEVVFVTGRPPRWMTHLAEHAGSHGLAVCSNGALLVDLRGDRIVQQAMLAPERVPGNDEDGVARTLAVLFDAQKPSAAS